MKGVAEVRRRCHDGRGGTAAQQLYERLAETIGDEQAGTMFELLPPPSADLASTADITRVEQRIDVLEQRMDGRFAAVEQRMDDRFAALEQRMDDRIDGLRGELLAAFRGELSAAMAAQTRTVVVASMSTALTITASALALSQLI